jgi:hypothetical protein
MPAPTKAEIIAALEVFKTDPNSTAELVAITKNYLPVVLADVTAVLGQADADITLVDISEVIGWLQKHWRELNSTQRDAAKSRLVELRVSVTSIAPVKDYLTQIMRRYIDIGDDNDTVLDRLSVVLALPAEDVDVTEFQHLMERAKAVWDELL